MPLTRYPFPVHVTSCGSRAFKNGELTVDGSGRSSLHRNWDNSFVDNPLHQAMAVSEFTIRACKWRLNSKFPVKDIFDILYLLRPLFFIDGKTYSVCFAFWRL